VSVTVLSGATVVTMDPARRVLTDGAVAFSSTDGSILVVGPSAVVREQYPGAEVVDCAGSVVLPGFVNTHTHLFQTLLKGLGDDRVLSDWFTTMTGPSAVELTEDDVYVYAGALHGCAEALTTGTTTLLDFMYVHPRPGLGDAVARAMTDAGIRGVMARGYMTAGTDVGVPAPLVEPVSAPAGRLCRRATVAAWTIGRRGAASSTSSASRTTPDRPASHVPPLKGVGTVHYADAGETARKFPRECGTWSTSWSSKGHGPCATQPKPMRLSRRCEAA
jgi:cytosine/adenosine deaminase-related metal-dependent hydrolase